MSKTLEFKSFCIEAYKSEHKLTGKETVRLFAEYGVLDYLDKCYGVLHTQGRDYLVYDIDEFIKVRT